MGRRIPRLKSCYKTGVNYIGYVFLLTAGFTAPLRAEMPVIDVGSITQLSTIANNAAQQLAKLQSMSSELQSMNSILGTPLSSSIMGTMGKMGGLSGQFAGLLSDISSPYADSLSSLNAFTSRHGAPDFSKFLVAKGYIESKLFVEEGSQPLSISQHDEIRSERVHVMRESSINSFALSSQQKNSVKRSHEQIEHIAGQAIHSPTIHDDLRATNQLLAIIATELVQQRALIAQQLELNAAVIAEQMPLVFKSTSLAKQNSQSSTPTPKPWGQ